VAGQAEGIAVGHHQAFGVAEAAPGVAVAVDHRAQLAVFVVPVLCELFDGLVVDHALEISLEGTLFPLQQHATLGVMRFSGMTEAIASDLQHLVIKDLRSTIGILECIMPHKSRTIDSQTSHAETAKPKNTYQPTMSHPMRYFIIPRHFL